MCTSDECANRMQQIYFINYVQIKHQLEIFRKTNTNKQSNLFLQDKMAQKMFLALVVISAMIFSQSEVAAEVISLIFVAPNMSAI